MDNTIVWSELTRRVKCIAGEPVPHSLRDRLMADARSEAAAVRLRNEMDARRPSFTKRLLAMPKLTVAVALVIMLALVFGLTLPTHKAEGDTLAALAAAMDRVSAVHYVGWMDTDVGHVRLEGWMRGSVRQRISVGYDLDFIKNGGKLLTMTPTTILQRPSEGLVKTELLQMQYFTGDYWRSLAAGNETVDTDIEVQRAANTTSSRIIIRQPAGETVVLTIDEETGLIVNGRVYSYSDLLSEMDDIQYDVEIPDSVFSPEIHKLAVGQTVSATVLDRGAAHGLEFQALAPTSGVKIVADPARKVFRLFGDVRLRPSGIKISNGVVAYSGEPIVIGGE
ncbi:MAG: hypothetical protein A2Z18_11285 [Armatimonadetes bacterium RBG_16_58_9]|nr:MAG: hypothetical protein A2Z18_11285 [Armatimonadetes bacterium RBG_16_58_9]